VMASPAAYPSLRGYPIFQIADALTPLPGNKILEIFSHMCNICNTYPEKAVTALGRVISGYTATECKKTVRTS